MKKIIFSFIALFTLLFAINITAAQQSNKIELIKTNNNTANTLFNSTPSNSKAEKDELVNNNNSTEKQNLNTTQENNSSSKELQENFVSDNNSEKTTSSTTRNITKDNNQQTKTPSLKTKEHAQKEHPQMETQIDPPQQTEYSNNNETAAPIKSNNSIKDNSETKTIREKNKEKGKSSTVTWISPVFINKTSLKVYSIKIEIETPKASSTASFGSNNKDKIKDFINPNQKKSLDGSLIFSVDFFERVSKNKSIVSVKIKAKGSKDAAYTLMSSSEYHNQVDGNEKSFWFNTSSIPADSPSNITLSFNKKKNYFELDTIFNAKGKNSETKSAKYSFGLIMKYKINKRELLGL